MGWSAALPLLVAGLTAACGATSGGPDQARPTRGEPFSRPLEIYRELGFLTGPGQFPVVASFGTLAGPADSTHVLLALSMPNSALRFQRAGAGFFAEYTLNLTFMNRDSAVVKQFDTREVVRIPSFAETGRTDESVVYHHAVTLQPGAYIVRLQAADAHSSRGFAMTDTLTVPDYTQVRLSTPLLVYQAAGRTSRTELPQLIPNPRHTVPYGGDSPLLYLEAYRAEIPAVDVRVLNDEGAALWSARATLREGEAQLRYGVIEIPSATLPLGRFWVEVVSDDASHARTPLILTISDQWMVANFEEVLQFLRYIAYPEEIDSLRAGSPTERREAWERFWERRDPLPITDLNEYRDQFFQRVRYATEEFREAGGRAGWNTDRGEVYIVLGPPDHSMERYLGNTDVARKPNAEEWVYSTAPGGRLVLLFHDRTGFGRYELTPSSAQSFRTAAERAKPRRPRS